MNRKKVLVIAGGFAGLASSALLAKSGFNVTLIEKNDCLGGRARLYKEKDFLFDMGPSWYLMPEVFESFYKIFGKKAKDFYELKRINPNYRIFFGNNAPVDVPSEKEKLKDLFEKMEPGSSKNFEQYMKTAQYQYDVAMKEFMYKPYKSFFDFFTPKILKEGLKLHIFEGLDNFAKRFFKNEKIRKILEYTVVFLGGSPQNTPALYSIMSHVDFDLGVWYPYGGMFEIVKALQKIAEENGVKIITNCEATKINVENSKAKSVSTTSGIFEADIILSNADYQHMEEKLLDEKLATYGKKYWERKKMGPSGFIVYLGLNKKIKNLLHHNLYLDESWDDHFSSIFDKPSWPDSPSYYVSCPSKTDDSCAPEGCENMFILVPIASGIEDTKEIREKYLKKTIQHLEKLIGEKISDAVIVKRTFSINDFIKDYNSYKGTALGMSHTLFQTAIFRPSFKSKKIKNLYYAGNYTHPGIGVPMAIISSQITSKEIEKEHGK